MKEIIAYEMVFDKILEYQDGILCVPFQKKYWDEYMKIYNECFSLFAKWGNSRRCFLLWK